MRAAFRRLLALLPVARDATSHPQFLQETIASVVGENDPQGGRSALHGFHLQHRGSRDAVTAHPSAQPASVALHAKFQFEEVGRLKLSPKFGRWLDVIYMELLL